MSPARFVQKLHFASGALLNYVPSRAWRRTLASRKMVDVKDTGLDGFPQCGNPHLCLSSTDQESVGLRQMSSFTSKARRSYNQNGGLPCLAEGSARRRARHQPHGSAACRVKSAREDPQAGNANPPPWIIAHNQALSMVCCDSSGMDSRSSPSA